MHCEAYHAIHNYKKELPISFDLILFSAGDISMSIFLVCQFFFKYLTPVENNFYGSGFYVTFRIPFHPMEKKKYYFWSYQLPTKLLTKYFFQFLFCLIAWLLKFWEGQKEM